MISSAFSAEVKSLSGRSAPEKPVCVLFHLVEYAVTTMCDRNQRTHDWKRGTKTLTLPHATPSCLAYQLRTPWVQRLLSPFNVLSNVPFDLWQVETVRSDLMDTFNLFFLFSVLSEWVAPHEIEDTIPHNKGGKAAFSVALPHRASVYFAFVTLCRGIRVNPVLHSLLFTLLMVSTFPNITSAVPWQTTLR